MRRLVALAVLALALPASAEDAPVTPNAIVAAAPAADWQAIDPADLLVMDLAPDRDGNPRRVVFQLIPAPFSQGWVGNIRKLAAAHWWDGTSINRVQDNYVVQWGDVTEKKALPNGLTQPGEEQYSEQYKGQIDHYGPCPAPRGDEICKTTERPADEAIAFFDNDSYTGNTGFYSGWPIGMKTTRAAPLVVSVSAPGSKRPPTDIPVQLDSTEMWPTHCYGMVGVGRNVSPDTGTGAELYTVIGQAPRQLDRNIALVGRIIEGMENLSSLPRGHGDLGFYADDEADKRVPILSVRLGNEIRDLPRFEYLSTESKSFAAYVHSRANRKDDFYIQPAGGVDICNVPVPIRRAPQ
ncbi:MAG: peptidylprolyl isomerase [Novosphingobium sp.]|nr:peptidylprolyl isomerase [Novosphingobium sp.]MBO9604007.1 peptidylprolyl isomerase [Novosphingobium sp.]